MVATLRPRSPGVYVHELATLPPSVAEVATAIPAFIGYTEIGHTAGGHTVERITSMLEYEAKFGYAKPTLFTVAVETNAEGVQTVTSVAPTLSDTQYLLYYSLSLYFSNGGGPCYIITIGDYTSTPEPAHFTAGLGRLAAEDEPTLILFPDAVNLTATQYYDLCDAALLQCNELKDRFCIIDVISKAGDADPVATLRGSSGIVTNPELLKYGAAYYPYLKTSVPYRFLEKDVTVNTGAVSAPSGAAVTFGPVTFNGLEIGYQGAAGDVPKVVVVAAAAGGQTTVTVDSAHLMAITFAENARRNDVIGAWDSLDTAARGGFTLASQQGSSNAAITAQAERTLQAAPAAAAGETLDALKTSNTGRYNLVKSAMTSAPEAWATMPPSPAIAGVYAFTDRTRGVWKAPANIGLIGVNGPDVKITTGRQDVLNIDETAGKSVNAIRAFAGKGTMVWGARTLAGNDNEWRYINVRRLFSIIEESIQKATAFAVFESNDATTWLKVKSMIEGYLLGLWEQGALAGPTPAAAYFVNVGLGKTMTVQDVLEGRMIVKVGIAAVRPAEFIILVFSHKLQEA